jgi:chromosome segregation ATPase
MKFRFVHLVSGCALTLTALIFAASLVGCGARGEVAKEKVLSQIDKLLGETEVQKKEMEISLRNMHQAVEKLNEGRISATVQLEKMQEKVEAQEARVNKNKDNLAALATKIKEGQSVSLGGKSYNPDELKEIADKAVDLTKSAKKELESLRRSQKNLEVAVSSLTTRHKEAKEKLSALEGKVREFDSKIAELKTLKDARALAGDSDKTLAANFEALEKQIEDIHTKTETDLRVEQERWKDVSAKTHSDDVEKIVSASRGVDGTLAEIDRILNGK